MAEDVRLQVRDVDLKLEDFHLKKLNLQIFQGEYFVLLGPTGAGKTVLLEAIAGLKPFQTGELILDGKEITNQPPDRRQIGFVYQEYALFPHLSVRENIAFGLELMPRSKLEKLSKNTLKSGGEPLSPAGISGGMKKGAFIDSRVADISALLKISHLLDRDPGTLSGGEKQRVALARALVVEPRLLLLDEPLSALDPETSETLQEELKRIHRALGTTTLHITHNFAEAVALGDRIGVIFEGQILQVGEPQQVFRKPANEKVARFVGVRNIFQGRLREGKEPGYKIFETAGLQLAVLTEHTGEVRASIRPEDIILSVQPVQSSARNSLQGVVEEVEDRGSFVYVTAAVRGGKSKGETVRMTSLITHRSLQEMAITPGDNVYLAFKAPALHIF